MKISSASKKVLASALSAAMVVAFAPTVAFGATKTPVTIDLDGGVLETGTTSFPEATATTTINLPTASKDGYGILNFWWDKDSNGLVDSNETYDPGTFTPTGATGAVTLKAVYKTPVVNAVSIDQAAEGTDVDLDVDVNGFVDGVTTIAKKNSNYTLAVKKGDTTLKSWEYVATAALGETDKYVTTADAEADHTLKFQYNPNSADTDAILLSNLTSGKYTVELADDKGVVSSKEFEIVKVTFEPAEGDAFSYFYVKSTGFDASGITAVNSKTWLTADGYAFSQDASKSFSGDVTVKESTATQTIAQDGSNAFFGADTVKFKVADTDAAKTGDAYAITLTDSTGAVVYEAAKTLTADGAWNQGITLTFDTTAFNVEKAKTSKVAGAYTVTVVKTPKSGAAATTVKSKIFTLTEFKYVAGEGTKFADAYKTADKQDVFVADATKTTGFANDFATAKDGYENVTYTLNGKAPHAVSNPIAVGGVNTITATATATDTSNVVAKPAVASATRALQANSKTLYDYTVKLSCATAGAQIVYTTTDPGAATELIVGTTTGATNYNAATGIKLSDAAGTPAAGAIWVQAKQVAGATASAIDTNSSIVKVVFNTEIGDFAAYTAGATSQLEAYVGKSTAKWLADEGVAAAIASGKAAIEAQGYYVVDGSESDAATVKAAYKALYEAVDAAAKTYLAKYEDGAYVVEGSKAYTMTAANLKAAKTAITTTENTVKTAEAAATTGVAAASVYKGAIYTAAAAPAPAKGLLVAVDDATYGVPAGVTAADIAAAQAVSAQLTGADTGEAAKAALEAYAALTDAQKKLVPSADLAAAQKVAAEAAQDEAAEELKNAQDDAAVSKARNASKTVKLAKGKTKTTKKQSVTLKAITSASGAKVTYKKSSGSSKVSVKSGKAYLAKGVKKGTYKATVKATCGTQTAKITVKFTVKA